MTETHLSEICCYQGLVQPHQADVCGALRVDAAASIVADAWGAFLALRRDSNHAQREASPAPVAAIVAMTLDRANLSDLRPGDLASCWIDSPSDAAASTVSTARLTGAGGPAWQATLRLSCAPPDDSRDAAQPPPDHAWPPMRIMRLMRKHHCDQAGHVNVQVFMDLVDEAVGVLCLQPQQDAVRLQIVRARISFKQELFEGDLVSVHSGIQRVDPQGADVVHGIVHQPSGRLACVVETRIARLDASGKPTASAEPLSVPPGESIAHWPSLPLARPTSLPGVPSHPIAHASTTVMSVVDAWDADRTGWLNMRALVDLCSTGARQYLAGIGLNGARFRREKITVAAVDYSVDIPQRPLLGCNLTLRSAYLSGSAKSIRFSHHIVDSDDGTVYATVEIVGVMLDLATHRSMEVPKDVRQRLGLAAD